MGRTRPRFERAAACLANGICQTTVACKMKPEKGWGWILFGGIVPVTLCFMIGRQWPVSGVWAIGVLLDIHVLMVGSAMIFVGSGARGIAATIEDAAGNVAAEVQELAGGPG